MLFERDVPVNPLPAHTAWGAVAWISGSDADDRVRQRRDVRGLQPSASRIRIVRRPPFGLLLIDQEKDWI